jgi:hypothetical protein
MHATRTRRWRGVAAAVLATAAVAGGANAGPVGSAAPTTWLYGADASSALFVVDASSGAARRIGDTGVRGITDIAFTPNGRLYGVSFTQLYSLDPRTGRATPIGTGLGMGSVNALASDSHGRLHVASTSGDFGVVAIGTGRATRIGSYGPGLVSSGDLAFARDGALYATARSSRGEVLLRVDTATGIASVRARLPLPDVYGLAFGPNGKLVGAARGNATPAVLVSVDRRTGRTKRIGLIPGARGMWGLATRPNAGAVTAPPPASAIEAGFFKTPSGNIVCFHSPGPADMPQAFLACGIKSGLEPPPPRRPCQDGDYAGDRVTMLATGRVSVPSCAGDPGALVGEREARVLGYGASWSDGGMRCTSAVTGLTCRNKSGHGFFLSRENWRAF